MCLVPSRQVVHVHSCLSALGPAKNYVLCGTQQKHLLILAKYLCLSTMHLLLFLFFVCRVLTSIIMCALSHSISRIEMPEK